MATPHIAAETAAVTSSSKISRLLQSQAVLSLLLVSIRSSSLGIKFLSTLYIARFLGLEALGFYGLITAATIVLPIMLGLGLGYTLCRKAVTATPEQLVIDLKYYIRFFALTYAFPSIAVIIYGKTQDQLLIYSMVILVIGFEQLNGSSYQLLQNLSKPISANILHFIRSSFWVVVFMAYSFFYEPGRNIETLLIMWVLGSAFAFACFIWLIKDWPWHTQLPSKSLISWILFEFKMSKKAYFLGVFETLSIYQDRYLIGYFLGLELTGVYVFFWQITSAMGNLLWTGVVQVTRPKLVKAFKQMDPAYEKIYKNCLVQATIGAVLASAMSVVGLKLLLPYLHKPLVEELFGIYYLMVLSFILSVVRETQKLRFYSQHRDDLLLNVSMITVVCSTIFTIICVMLGGLWGASLSMLLVATCSVVVQVFYKKRLKQLS